MSPTTLLYFVLFVMICALALIGLILYALARCEEEQKRELEEELKQKYYVDITLE